MTITEFLLARIAEDEAVARAASPAPWSYPGIESVAGGTLYDKTRRIADVAYEQPSDHDGSVVRHLLVPEADANGAHIARHDPDRVLAECEAKRRIVAECAASLADDIGPGEFVLLELATIYADHHDFDPAWRL